MTIKFVFLPPQHDVSRQWAAALKAELPALDICVPEGEEDALREIADADACFGFLTEPMLAAARNLRWLQAPLAAPPAGFYHQAMIDHPLVVTNFREIYNDHISAHIMGFLLAFARGFDLYSRAQQSATWLSEAPRAPVHLPEATALIVGLGGIGVETARLLHAFGVTVLATDARRTELTEGVAELHPPQALPDLLPRSDFVIATIPHTPETEGLFDRDCFARMKRTAFFINIGRGMTTRLTDLAQALEAKEIAGAALDVFEQEPLPPDHPLWHMPNVMLTPHAAWRGPYIEERRYAILADNCRAFGRGEALRNMVDKALWF